MRNLRRHLRITDTRDLVASLRSAGRSPRSGRVINLSQGGMLVHTSHLEVGETTAFELLGPGFRYAGLAEVVHRTNGAAGLRFLGWQGHAERPLRALIESRSNVPTRTVGDHQQLVRRIAVLIGAQRAPAARS